MKLKALFATIILSHLLFSTFAQTPGELASKKMIDSLKEVAMSEYAKKYPALRQGSFAVDILGKGNVKAILNDKDLYEADMRVTKVRSNFNIPIAKWGKNIVTGTVSYQQIRFETEKIKSYDQQMPLIDFSTTKSTVGFTASFIRTDSIFNHPINYSGSISGVTDEFSSIKRINYLGVVTVPVKRSQYSALSLGLVVILDPSAAIPVIPIVSYWHKYKESELELFIDFPSRIALRKQLSKRSWTSVGSDLGGSLFFFDLNEPSLPQSATYTSADLRTGATFEYLLTKKLIFGVNGGLYTTTSPRIFKRNEKPNDYFLKTKNATVPFVSFSVSFLPFLKK